MCIHSVLLVTKLVAVNIHCYYLQNAALVTGPAKAQSAANNHMLRKQYRNVTVP